MIKKAASLLMSFVMLLSAITVVYAEESAYELKENEYYKRLVAFGVADPEDYITSDEAVTRAQFAKYAVKIGAANINSLPADDKDAEVFTDVTSKTENYKYILAAAKLGYMKGTGESVFSPDDSISIADAARVLIRVLGYDEVISRYDNYENGYLNALRITKLLDGISKTDGILNAGELIRMLYNAVNAPVVIQTSAGMRTEYVTDSDVNILSKNFHIYRDNGVVESNKYTNLVTPQGTGKDTVTIGGTEYEDNGTAWKYIGVHADFYYRKYDDGTAREIVYIENYKNILVTELERDSINIDKSTLLRLYYDENGKEEYYDIAGNASFIKNGVLTTVSVSDLKPHLGTVTLIDNDRDGTAETVVIWSYENMIVGSVSGETKIIHSKDGSSFYDFNEKNSYVHIEKDGKTIKPGTVPEDSLISVAQSVSDSKPVYFVSVSTLSITGTVTGTEYGSDNSVSGIYVDGVYYEVVPGEGTYYRMSVYGTFYLDIFGKIAAYDTENATVYGFLYKLAPEGADFGEPAAKIYTENDRWVTLKFARRVSVNGEASISAYEILGHTKSGLFAPYGTEKKFVPQLVTYNVNAQREICRINTAVAVNERYSREEQDLIDRDVFRLSLVSEEGFKYFSRKVAKAFGDKIHIDENTRIFCVPGDFDTCDDDDFKVIRLSDVITDRQYVKFYAYDVDEFGLARALVLGDGKNNTFNSGVLFVNSISNAVDSNNEYYRVVNGFENSVEVSIPVYDLNLADKLHSGDVISYGLDMNVGFEKIILLYNPMVYETSDVISTYVYRVGLQNYRYGYSTAVGLFNSVINFALIVAANKISKKVNGMSLW